MNGEPRLLIAIDRFSEWPTAKTRKTAETKEVVIFLTNHFNLYGNPERKNPTKGGIFSSEYKELFKSRKIEVQYCPQRIHTGNGTVEKTIQTHKSSLLGNMEDGNTSTESII